jgi:hypothetical protein
MTIKQPQISRLTNLKGNVEAEAKKAFFLTLYLASWFCALVFLAATTMFKDPIPFELFGFAFIKAAICAKFMLIGQAIYPMVIDKANGILKMLLKKSLTYLAIVIALSFIEAGVEGWFHGKDFFASLSNFGHGHSLHIAALSIVYWLIIWPYLIFISLKMALGPAQTSQIFFGTPIK